MSIRRLILLIVLIFSRYGYSDKQPVKIEQEEEEIIQMLSVGLKGKPQERPLLILVGGFQGSGKTTLSQVVQSSYGLATISLDAIRQALMDKDKPRHWETVSDLYQKLLRMALHQRLNIILDTNAHSGKIKAIELFLEQEKLMGVYQIVKLCLNPPYETLIERVRRREQKPGVHQGNEEDLQESVVSKKIHLQDYDLVIDTEKLSFQEEWKIVSAFLDPYLKSQRE